VAYKTITKTARGREVKLPEFISADDHVLEPADLWSSRLPAKFLAEGPRIVREKGLAVGNRKNWTLDEEKGLLADVWYYEDVRWPIRRTSAAVGFANEDLDWEPTTYEEVRPGTWQPKQRLADMDQDHVSAAICFPNTLPRFCGQTFSEGKDRELGLACVRAYNDWMNEEWAGPDTRGRLIPLTIIPLWDAKLAAAEVRRCAEKGSHAVTFSENPSLLGFPTIYSGFWDPFFQACDETETTVTIHIGSSSTVVKTSPDAPSVATSTLSFQNGMHSLIDLALSGTLARFPNVKVMYSETNVGWAPYVIERMDKLWDDRKDVRGRRGMHLSAPPSSYVKGRVYGCIVDDEVGLVTRDYGFGMDHICFESDYPHANCEFPNTLDVAADLCVAANLNDEEIYKFLRGNAIQAFGLERFGVTE
jgi:predicted TIM-barrel fold metal-dependent hydrolase